MESLSVASYTLPTDGPEADGTLAWSSTTLVCATARAAGCEGLGWTYAPAACGALIEQVLAPRVIGVSALAIPACTEVMGTAVRNSGRTGLAAYAISAVDVALWDLKARILGVSLTDLLGGLRQGVPIYASGGFTTYDAPTMTRQLNRWLSEGIRRIKIKIGERGGSNVDRDLDRVDTARQVIGATPELYVDASGAYSRKQAVRVGRALEAWDVRWFEEPVPSGDKDGLGIARASLDVDIAAGGDANDVQEFRRLCEVVDCLQVDASRCGGVSGWLRAAAVASAFGLEVSGHCAPHLHLAVAAATPNLRHLEWFHDHVRIESRFLDGVEPPRSGCLRAETSGTGHGYVLKRPDLEEYRVG